MPSTPDPAACKAAMDASIDVALSEFNTTLAACGADEQCQAEAYLAFKVAIANAVQKFFECIAATYGIPE